MAHTRIATAANAREDKRENNNQKTPNPIPEQETDKTDDDAYQHTNARHFPILASYFFHVAFI